MKTRRYVNAMDLNRALDEIAALPMNDLVYADGQERKKTCLDRDPNSQKASIDREIMPYDCFKNSGQMYRMIAEQFRSNVTLKTDVRAP